MAPDPDDPPLQRRFADRVDGAVILLTGDVPSDGRAGIDLPVRLKSGEVRRYDLPSLTFIGGLVEVLRRMVNGVGVVRRNMDRRHALESELHVPRVVTVNVGCPNIVLPLLPSPLVVSAEPPFTVGENNPRFAGLRDGRARFTSAHRRPEVDAAARRIQRRMARD